MYPLFIRAKDIDGDEVILRVDPQKHTDFYYAVQVVTEEEMNEEIKDEKESE